MIQSRIKYNFGQSRPFEVHCYIATDYTPTATPHILDWISIMSAKCDIQVYNRCDISCWSKIRRKQTRNTRKQDIKPPLSQTTELLLALLKTFSGLYLINSNI